jgi:hypothetical protein
MSEICNKEHQDIVFLGLAGLALGIHVGAIGLGHSSPNLRFFGPISSCAQFQIHITQKLISIGMV